MSRNGAGVYTAPAASFPAVSMTLIESSKFNDIITDMAAALTASIAADGQTTITADIPMASHKFTGMVAGSGAGHSVEYAQMNSAIAAFSEKVVDSITALKALDKTAITKAFVTGYYAKGDGGGGSYYYDAADTTTADNGGTVIVATDGGRWKLLHNGEVSIKQFGAKLDGTTDDTPKWVLACASGNNIYWPPGPSRVTDKITLQNGRALQGAGSTKSYFVIDSGFNMAATSVLQLGTGEPGAHVFDVGFMFSQANQSVRANVTNYPYAISISGIPRAVADRIRIENGWNGIDARGNCGGSYLGFLEIGTLNTGLAHDGSLDFFHGGHWHFWPFGISGLANLLTVYYDGVGVAATIGASDGFNVDSICTFSQKILITASATTAIPLQIGKLQLDGDGARLLVAGGNTQIGISYSTKSSAASSPSVDVSAGTLILSSHRISSNLASNELHTSGTGRLFVMGGEFDFVNTSNSVARSDGGLLSLDGIRMRPAINAAYTQGHCTQASGILQVNNCNWDTVGTGSGIAVYYASDASENVCQNNHFGDWQYGPPAAYALGKYDQNFRSISTDVINNLVVGTVKMKRLVVTADGAGNYVGAHGVSSLNLKLLSASALSRGASAEAIVPTVVYVDGTNVSISGAIAGSRVRITLVYTETQDAW